MLKGLSEQELNDHGLDARDILIHQRRIHGSLSQQKTSFIKILETWRLDNHGILPQRYLKDDGKAQAKGFVAFIPAAGAASRYFQPLQDLRMALADQDQVAIRVQLEALKKQGAEQWPLPKSLSKLLNAANDDFNAETVAAALYEIDSPKALLPARKSGPSFLKQKHDEHAAMNGLDGEVYVAPLGYSEKFAEHLKAEKGLDDSVHFMEQGSDLCTLRFTREGLPYRCENGKISLVPAGHGMLVRLFPKIKEKFPTAHSLFIRNIDNVIEEGAVCIADTELFLMQHQQVLEGLKRIRASLEVDRIEQAAVEADQLRERFVSRMVKHPGWLKDTKPAYKKLWTLLFELFHCPFLLAEELKEGVGEKEAIIELYKRPLNALGQVPNNGKDVGGSPVRAKHESGEVSICLELPHASPDDRKTYLENAEVATHFNPVFVAAEIPEDIAVYDLEQCPFWILAEKNIRATPVVYHEIVLYEVLGNSYTANVLFPEIPRRLFQPHKTLLDGLKK